MFGEVKRFVEDVKYMARSFHGGRHGQFPTRATHQRRLRAAQETERLWLDFRFEAQARCLRRVLPGLWGASRRQRLKLALGEDASMAGRLLLFNALDMKFRELKLRRLDVPDCGGNPTIKESAGYERSAVSNPRPPRRWSP